MVCGPQKQIWFIFAIKMTSYGNIFDNFPENRLTKFGVAQCGASITAGS